MNFFTKEDFEGPMALNRWVKHDSYEYREIVKFIVRRANEKIEKVGKVVYTCSSNIEHEFAMWHENGKTASKLYYKAILLNIEPIEKCTHPKEKVTMRLAKWEGGLVVGSICKVTGKGLPGEMTTIDQQQWFQCECGAQVQPKEFEEMK